jgi:hypothetical protein
MLWPFCAREKLCPLEKVWHVEFGTSVKGLRHTNFRVSSELLESLLEEYGKVSTNESVWWASH